MNNIFTFIILMLECVIVMAQSPNWQWAKSAGGNDDDVAQSVTTDAFGNIYVVGKFASSSIIFGSTTLNNADTINVGITSDIYIVKYDANGNVLWAKSVGGNRYDIASSVTAGVSGNIYVTGYFSSDSITFGSITLTNGSNGGDNMFLAKYDPTGKVLWAKNNTGGSGVDSYSATTDASGNIYITGCFGFPSVTFGSITLTTYLNWSGSNMFLVKYDSNGNVLWAKGAGGGKSDCAYSVAEDASGDIYVAGDFTSYGITFGSIALTNVNQNNVNRTDVFLVKYDSNGNVLWAKSAGGSESDFAYSVATDVSGNSYVTGSFYSSSIIFGSTTLTNAGGLNSPSDMFLAKYDVAGNVLWAKSAGGISIDDAYSIKVDVSGNILVAGDFASDSITFDSVRLINTGFGSDIFLTKYDASGSVLWAKSVGGSIGGNNDDKAYSVTSFSGNVYVAGYFQRPTFIFGSTILINANNTGYTDDMFIAKLSSTTGIIEVGSENAIPIYPNPSSGIFAIQIGSRQLATCEIEIYNVFGEKILSQKIQSENLEIDISNQPNGIYFVQLKTDQVTVNKKIVINK